MKKTLDQAIETLLANYHELNGSEIGELYEPPSPLEFLRHVARNVPFVVRGGIAEWHAVKTWKADYLRTKLGSQGINVAVTPSGYADVPVMLDDGTTTFAKPLEEEQQFEDFLNHVTHQELQPCSLDQGDVRYAQTQNDNLRGEYAMLLPDVARNIEWARVALGSDADAINLWIGNSKSVTALHKDNYENIYCQVSGCKHFVLLPPVAHACVNEQELSQSTYVRGRNGGDLVLEEDEDAPSIPFPLWDPDTPTKNCTKFSRFAKPMRVTLQPGDMLYLPTAWYHKVTQSTSPEGFCCAVNYWYDTTYEGSFYAMTTFVREVYSHCDQGSSEAGI